MNRVQRPGRWLYGIVVLVLLTANGAVLWFSYQSLSLSKTQYERSAEIHAANIAEAINENLNTAFEKVDLLLSGIAEECRRQLTGTGLDLELVESYVEHVRTSMPQINNVVMTDAEGRAVLVNGLQFGRSINLSDRDYFLAARANAHPPLLVSKLLRARIDGAFVTLVAKRLDGVGGRFEGVVAADLTARYIHDMLAVYDLGSEGEVTVRDTDGALVAKFTTRPDAVNEPPGSRLVPARFKQFVDSGAKTAVVHIPQDQYWSQRILAPRRMDRAPLVVSVSVGTQDYLKGWMDQLVSTIWLDVGFFLLSAVAGAMLVRALHRVEQEKSRFQAARDMAESSNAAKGQFLANMSHELRTPMNAVLGMHELLLATELTPRQKDYVVKSRVAAASLLDILNGILDFSKIEAGKLDLEAVPFSLETLLRELSVIASSSLGEKEIELLYDLDPRIPSALIGDPLRLKQVLINLCGNAVKFTQNGEIVVEARLLTVESEAQIEFAVVDTGLGISAEQKTIIFQAFSQADVSTSRRFGGTGLGLTISQRLVRIMGGTIAVESEPGRGSRFSFTLSLPLPGADAAPRLSFRRLLIVSRNEKARRVYASMAEAAGWEYEIHSSVAEAENGTGQPDSWPTAVVDLWAVEADDWMACARLRQVSPAIRVLGLVNPHQLETVRASASAPAGFHGFLVKPFTVSMLAEAIDELAVQPSRPESRPQPRRLEGVRLLVAEDNPFNQQVAIELLQGEGAAVSVASDGNEAVRKLREGTRFDAVLMDMRMPGMDGLDATRHIRQTLGMKDIPIIAMTANALPSDKAACFEAGMDDHIAKPIARDKLVETLKHFLRRTEPSAPEFDVRAALERLGNEEGTLEKVLAFWLNGAKTLPAELRAAAGDPETLARFYHSLKGSAAAVGGIALSQFAAQIEKRLAEDPRWFQLDVVGPDTEARVAALAREVDQYLKTKERAS